VPNDNQIIDAASIMPHVAPAYRSLMLDATRNLVLCGGAGSGKSHFCAQKSIYDALAYPGIRILGTRKVARSIKRSNFALVESLIHDYGLTGIVSINRQELDIRFHDPVGSHIMFTGLDDVEKIKSITGISRIWCEEASEMDAADFDQLSLRLRGNHPGGYFQIMLSFNPVLPAAEWIRQRWFVNRFPDSRVMRSTYLHNPHLDPEYITLLENLQTQNTELDRVYRQGLFYRDDSAVVFQNVVVRDETFFPQSGDSYYGLDFGFTNPNALVELLEYDGTLYCRQRLYQSRLTADDLITEFKNINVDRHKIMYCDNANPGDIETLRRAGYRAVAQDKRPGSVLAGIRALNTLPRIVLRKNDTDMISEMNGYRWRETKGITTEEPVKLNDHCPDAIRAAYFTHHVKEIMGRGKMAGGDLRKRIGL